MGVFSGLSDKLNHIFSKMKARGKLSELEIKQAMREVRVALLEADVNLFVAKDFINKVSEKAVGQEILKSLSPAQQVIKIVNEELIALMGSTNVKLNAPDKPPMIIMMCGLQGAGKTTMCGKLSLNLKKQGKKVLLVACDIYRPAAINQLKVVGGNVGVDVFERGQIDPVKIAREALAEAQKLAYDVVIIDTAGRLQIDEALMQELENLKAAVHPTDILLNVDAMTGQEAVNVATTFNERLDITGVVMTKLDGDTRGGATLSIKAVTGKPIKFCSVGEKPGDLEPFYPDRMASRILGMGDVLTLIEKAQEAVTEEEAEKLEKKMREASFTLEDYLEQFETIKKMGSMKDILAMLPGMGAKVKDIDIDEKQIERTKAIIRSMTPEERRKPELLNASRRRRISAGSGCTIQEVNQLIKQYEQTNQMMKQMRGGRGMGGLFGKRKMF